MRELGVRVCLWQLPYVPEGSAYYDELLAADGFVKTSDGEVYDTGLCWTPGFQGVVGAIDFTNPAAVEAYQRRLRGLFELGVAAIKVDFGEQAPIHGVYHDGTPGHLAHNLYPLLYNRAVAEVTEEVTGERVIWARSAWAGSQRLVAPVSTGRAAGVPTCPTASGSTGGRASDWRVGPGCRSRYRSTGSRCGSGPTRWWGWDPTASTSATVPPTRWCCASPKVPGAMSCRCRSRRAS
jgi:hypothetical protein